MEAEGYRRRGVTGLWCTRGHSQDRAGEGQAGSWVRGGWSGGARGRSMHSVLRAARWVKIFSMSSGVSMRQGLAPGVRAGGDAVVDGGAEKLLACN